MGFIKGQSGNPHGRPRKGKTLTDLLQKELNQKQGDIPAKVAVVKKLIELASEGDIAAIRYVFDRIEGKCTERVENTISAMSPENRLALEDVFTDPAKLPENQFSQGEKK
jgi:hypothetical protein